jgi:hypothetical protein
MVCYIWTCWGNKKVNMGSRSHQCVRPTARVAWTAELASASDRTDLTRFRAPRRHGIGWHVKCGCVRQPWRAGLAARGLVRRMAATQVAEKFKAGESVGELRVPAPQYRPRGEHPALPWNLFLKSQIRLQQNRSKPPFGIFEPARPDNRCAVRRSQPNC